ncbi:uncharacterized protein LOC107637210 [Arachis ipaensis]|uniref:uncharacterized protein LOC107637210 n=1 Tax=Arachis ipaensis TaxID=130454 RepID=UPI0007AF6B8A|nr:uncharacterized protein LOC107637210 [Arachis ipaensis]
MMLLGTQLFTDKSDNRIHIRWLPYVARLEDMDGYSWESAALSWGLGGVGKLSMVKELRKKQKLNMLGLVESKMQAVTKFDVARIWGSDAVRWEFVGSEGTSGGLLLMWDDLLFRMNNCYKGERWLCVEGILLKNEFCCAFCLVYGAHNRIEKLAVWEELSFIAGLCQVPICYMGDFNEVLQVEERKGQDRLTASAEDFKSWVQDMQLVDLPLTDRKYTWFRGRSCSRIDRVLVSVEWTEEFPEIRLKGGPRGLSDHCPIIVQNTRYRGGSRPFRSLDCWFTHEGFLRMVREEWRNLGIRTNLGTSIRKFSNSRRRSGR